VRIRCVGPAGRREYQLHREEMAIAREDARAQRQLMNVMMMAMLNRNGGGIVLIILPCSRK
jgi:hypothetical protein